MFIFDNDKKALLKQKSIIVVVILFIIALIIIFTMTANGRKLLVDDFGQEYFIDRNNAKICRQQVKYKNNTYFTDENGYIYKDTWVGDNYYGSDGKMLKNDWCFVKSTNRYYYLDKNGKYVLNRIMSIDNKTYAFDNTGALYQNMFFVSPNNSNKFMYANENGEVQKGNNFININGIMYYVDKDGYVKRNEWVEINGDWYYFDNNCVLTRNSWIDKTYYVGADGKMLKSTKTPEGYEVDSSGKILDKYKAYLNESPRTALMKEFCEAFNNGGRDLSGKYILFDEKFESIIDARLIIHYDGAAGTALFDSEGNLYLSITPLGGNSSSECNAVIYKNSGNTVFYRDSFTTMEDGKFKTYSEYRIDGEKVEYDEYKKKYSKINWPNDLYFHKQYLR